MAHPSHPLTPARERRMLGVLLLVYILNFVDRQIFAVLASPIKADLLLSDAQLGLLGGLAFALFYAVLGLPLGALADRTGRSRVIAWSLAIWSGCTAACALATGFAQLFACRLGVGIGEAGGVAPSYASIADHVPPARRGRALSIHALGIPLGSAAGVLLGGQIAQAMDWRAAFATVGLIGIAVAPFVRRAVPDRTSEPGDAVPIMEVLGILAVRPAFWLLSFGAGAGSIIGYGLAFWLPSLMQRSFALDIAGAGRFYGGLLLIGGVAGVLAGGWLTDRLSRRDGGAHALVPAIAYALSAPLFALGIMAPTTATAFALLLIPQALSFVWFAPVAAAIQTLVPPAMRATASACFLLINTLVGLGLGTWLIGMLSDAMRMSHGADALRHAMLWGLAFYLVAALLMACAVRPLRRGITPPAPNR